MATNTDNASQQSHGQFRAIFHTILAGVAALAVATVLTHGAPARADNPAYPITDPFGDSAIGIVEVGTTATGPEVTILLSAGIPNTVYTITLCMANPTGGEACAAAPGAGSFTTDAAGNGAAMVAWPASASILETVQLTDPAGAMFTATVIDPESVDVGCQMCTSLPDGLP